MSVNRTRIARGVCAGALGALLMVGTATVASAAPAAPAAPTPPATLAQAQRCVADLLPKALGDAELAARRNPQQRMALFWAAVANVTTTCIGPIIGYTPGGAPIANPPGGGPPVAIG